MFVLTNTDDESVQKLLSLLQFENFNPERFSKMLHRCLPIPYKYKMLLRQVRVQHVFKRQFRVRTWKVLVSSLADTACKSESISRYGRTPSTAQNHDYELVSRIVMRKDWKCSFKPSVFNSLHLVQWPNSAPIYPPFNYRCSLAMNHRQFDNICSRIASQLPSQQLILLLAAFAAINFVRS